jgi:hypothetical protein
VDRRVDLDALKQLKLVRLLRIEPRFVGNPACRNKYRATEIAHENCKIMNRKRNLAPRRVGGTAVTIGTVHSAAVAVAAAAAAVGAAVAVAAAAAAVGAEYYCH